MLGLDLEAVLEALAGIGLDPEAVLGLDLETVLKVIAGEG